MDDLICILRYLRPDSDFASSADFIRDGLLDSFDIIALVVELEQRYRICLDSMDIVPENFCCLDAMKSLVAKRGGAV